MSWPNEFPKIVFNHIKVVRWAPTLDNPGPKNVRLLWGNEIEAQQLIGNVTVPQPGHTRIGCEWAQILYDKVAR